MRKIFIFSFGQNIFLTLRKRGVTSVCVGPGPARGARYISKVTVGKKYCLPGGLASFLALFFALRSKLSGSNSSFAGHWGQSVYIYSIFSETNFQFYSIFFPYSIFPTPFLKIYSISRTPFFSGIKIFSKCHVYSHALKA